MSTRRKILAAPTGTRDAGRARRTGARHAENGAPQRIDLGTLNARTGYFVRRLQVWIFQDFIQTLKSVQIRPAQYSVLVLVAANPGLSQADLADTLGIERARLVRLLDELERRGLTARLPSTRDRRSHALFLTDQGRDAMQRIEQLVARHEEHVIEKLGAGRRKALIKLLKDFG